MRHMIPPLRGFTVTLQQMVELMETVIGKVLAEVNWRSRNFPTHDVLTLKRGRRAGTIGVGVTGMTAISVKTRVKPDGTVQVVVPTGLPESDVDVRLVIRPANAGSAGPHIAHAWPADFFDNTFGSLVDEHLARPPELDQEVREKLL